MAGLSAAASRRVRADAIELELLRTSTVWNVFISFAPVMYVSIHTTCIRHVLT